MTDWHRPGPTSIDAGGCPGGVVIHVYGVPSAELLTTSTIDVLAAVQAVAEAAADEGNALADPDDDGLCLVASWP